VSSNDFIKWRKGNKIINKQCKERSKHFCQNKNGGFCRKSFVVGFPASCKSDKNKENKIKTSVLFNALTF
jgi:hypothetical protein